MQYERWGDAVGDQPGVAWYGETAYVLNRTAPCGWRHAPGRDAVYRSQGRSQPRTGTDLWRPAPISDGRTIAV